MNNDTVLSNQDASKGSLALRVIVLSSLYALAVLFAVAFSPSMGVVAHHPASETANEASHAAGSVASMEPLVRR